MKTDKTILAIDQSGVCCGWSIWSNSKLNDCGGEKIIGKTEEEKLYYIYNFVNKLVKKYKPKEIVIEGTFYSKNVVTLQNLCRIQGVIMFKWYQHTKKIPVVFANPLEWKKALNINIRKPPYQGGTQKQKKQIVVTAVNKIFKLKLKIEDNDVADSIGIGKWFIDFHKGE